VDWPALSSRQAFEYQPAEREATVVSGVFRLKNDDEPVDGGGEVGTVGLERAKPTGVSAALRRCRGFDGDPAKLFGVVGVAVE
jgi:hypothetical protein